MPINIIITDDHPLAVNGIRTMLMPFPEMHVIATYRNGQSLLDGLTKQQADILLLDIMLPDISGKELAAKISKEYPVMGIIALTSLDAPAMVKSMMQRGCLGYLLKDTDEQTLVQAIEAVYNGKEFIEPSLKEHLLQHMFKHRKTSLTPAAEITQREREILKLIVEEYTTQEISDKLFISFRTVENHRYSLLQKLDVKNTAGLVRVAITMGIIDDVM